LKIFIRVMWCIFALWFLEASACMVQDKYVFTSL
jgi:hypothetical protein